MSMSVFSFSLLNKDIPFQVQGSKGTYVSLPTPSCYPQVIGLAQIAFVPFQKLAELRFPPSLSSRLISQLRPDTDLPPLSQVLTSIGMEVEKKTDEAVGPMGDAPADDSIDRALLEELQKKDRKAYQTKYYKDHKAQIAARKVAHHRAHRAKKAEYDAEYRRTHKAQIAAHNAECYKAHKVEIAARQVEYYRAHNAEIKARMAKYRKTHRAKAEKD